MTSNARNLAAVTVATDLLTTIAERLVDFREIRDAVESGSALTAAQAASAQQALTAMLSAKAQIDGAIAAIAPQLSTVTSLSSGQFSDIAQLSGEIAELAPISGEIASVAAIASEIGVAAENLAAIIAAPGAAGDAEAARDASVGAADAAAQSLAASVGLQSAVQITAVSASRPISLGDAGHLLTHSGSDDLTLTIPTDAEADFAVGAVVAVWQLGTGTIVLAAQGGVTVTSAGGDTLSQGRAASLVKVGADTWGIIGDMQ